LIASTWFKVIRRLYNAMVGELKPSRCILEKVLNEVGTRAVERPHSISSLLVRVTTINAAPWRSPSLLLSLRKTFPRSLSRLKRGWCDRRI
jgi:hypothetical protein